MINDRGVYWQFMYSVEGDLQYTSAAYDNAEAMRKAAQAFIQGRPEAYSEMFVLTAWKIDPVHGPVEIMP